MWKRQVLVTKQEAYNLNLIKKFYVRNSRFPSLAELSNLAGTDKRFAQKMIEAFVDVGIIVVVKRNCYRWSYRPYELVLYNPRELLRNCGVSSDVCCV